MHRLRAILRDSSILAPLIAAIRRARAAFRRRWHLRDLEANYAYDYHRFRRFGSSDRALALAAQQQAFVVMLAHSLEKGLALPSPRLGFGKDKLYKLLDTLDAYIRQNGDDWASQTAIAAVEGYLAHHASTPFADALKPAAARAASLRSMSRHWSEDVAGGTMPQRNLPSAITRTFDIDSFLRGRHSVRDFLHKMVPDDVIEHAVRLAQTAPSVCNRQAGRIHIIPRSHFADSILQLQDGNRGFGATASHVAVITTDVRCFLSIGERNQMWVDGGLFAMTLVYAFHGLGVGTCFLNWSADMVRDQQLRQRLHIPEWENVVTMLAIGYAPDGVRVCVSQRRPLRDVLTFHASPTPT